MALLDVRTSERIKSNVQIHVIYFHFQSNIALILHAAGEFRHSVRFLEHALALNIKYFGVKSLKVAVSYHLLARTLSCMGDFRSALNHEKETYAIYKQLVSDRCRILDRHPFQCGRFDEITIWFDQFL